jgi:hypothetical protein
VDYFPFSTHSLSSSLFRTGHTWFMNSRVLIRRVLYNYNTLGWCLEILTKFLSVHWIAVNISRPIPLAALSKASVCGRSLGGTAGSNPAGGMDGCLSVESAECGVSACDLDILTMKRLWPTRSCRAMGGGGAVEFISSRPWPKLPRQPLKASRKGRCIYKLLHRPTNQSLCFLRSDISLLVTTGYAALVTWLFNYLHFSVIHLFLILGYYVSCISSYGTASWSCCCSKAVHKSVWHIPLSSVQWITSDDGQRNCPKHVEFHFQNKFEKSVHLLGFIIRKPMKHWHGFNVHTDNDLFRPKRVYIAC